MTTEPAPISPSARRALEQELAQLRREHATLAATLTSADGTGDAADQADELQRAADLERLQTRLRDLEKRLSEAATADEPSTDQVGVGSTVTVRFSDGLVETVQIGDIAEALELTLVTTDSPLGRALLDHRVGDTVKYATPAGHTSAAIESIGA